MSLVLYLVENMNVSRVIHQELANPVPMTFSSLLSPPQSGESNDPPLTFAFSLPSFGKRVSIVDIELQYSEAITSLSDRLGKDQWFLGSQ